MKVGDLVSCKGHIAIVILANPDETLIRWLSDGTVSNARNYSVGLEVISESR